ncbi:pentapeptide repeat-containing protein [Dyella subtropica]|uniref:pentapeptide repeat-containing protein n=1 Tax=Dyella subtropica TaxID=2992127 RepID=UPI002252A68A|nr:pentapeptide repeat-containing protein [Dyella subtropica]
MFIFEGKFSVFLADVHLRFMFHVDKDAKRLRIQVDEREPDTRSFEEWATFFKSIVPIPFPAPRGLLSALAGAQDELEPERVALLAQLAGVKLQQRDRYYTDTVAPGVSDIRESKRCEKADFGPQGRTVIDLSNTDFTGVHFIDTNFSKAILTGVDFTDCTFERCTFGSRQLPSARMIRANFTKQSLVDMDLSGIKLEGAKLNGANIRGCNLSGASLKQASIDRAWLSGLNLTYAELDGMEGTATVFHDCNFAFATLKNAKLTRPAFGGSQLVSINAQNASLVNARFAALTLEEIFQVIDLQSSANGGPYEPATIHLADFSGATLTDARFDGVRISESTFAAAKLGKAIFGGTALRLVSFKDTELAGADFSAREAEYEKGQRMREPVPVASFEQVDFDNANLQGTNFRNAVLAGKVRHARTPRRDTSKKERMHLAGAKFTSSLLGTDWSYVDASGATIALDRPGDGTFKNFKAKEAILPIVDFAGLALIDADFESADLRSMRFGNCNLENAKFGRAILEAADFTGAHLQSANFANAILMNANFSHAWMWDATFNGAVLTEANFSSAMLAEVDFKGISDGKLSNVNFSGACLVSATFTNIKAPRSGNKQTNFSSACLAGADFVGASLMDVVLTRAQLSSKKGSIEAVHRLYPDGKTFDYDPTKLDARSTGPQTTCPDGRGGTCTTEQLHAIPVLARWPSSST